MYNYFMLIGRIAGDVEVKTLSDGRKVLNLVLAVVKPFKNTNGEYETDFFKVSLWEFIAEMVAEKFKKGSQIGIKGRLCSRKEVLENGTNSYSIDLIGERVVFFDNSDNTQKDIR